MAAPLLPYIKGLYDTPIGLPNLLDEIPYGIVVLDLDKRIVLINRALENLTGYGSRQVAGIHCCYILRSNLCGEHCPIDKLADQSGPILAEGNLVNRNRQRLPVRITASVIEDNHGKAQGFIETVEDITATVDTPSKASASFGLTDLIGRSREIQRVFQILPVIAMTDSSVLITGQTGTGKDLVAQAIHQKSDRAKGPFVKVNCGALPETLLESELFGHEKGAFTGAVVSKPGRFRMANNGTLYLTEIGDLPLSLQVKLLSFLDDKTVHPLGSAKSFRVDVRVVAATHRNLEQMVRQNKFREDLLFRLNVIRLQLPPLLERGDDIEILLDHFLKIFSLRFKKSLRGFSEEAHGILLKHPYPGNVRELRNIVEYAVNFCDESLIQTHHLPRYVTEPRPAQEDRAVEPEAPGEKHPPAMSLAPGDLDALRFKWCDVEKRLILEALTNARGRKGKAASLLGWGRSTLWRKMKKLGIEG